MVHQFGITVVISLSVEDLNMYIAKHHTDRATTSFLRCERCWITVAGALLACASAVGVISLFSLGVSGGVLQ